MKLSIIVPVYNVLPYIRQCLDSLVGQTLEDYEIILIDDGSTDGTRALIEQWIAAGVIDIRYIYQANQGMHGAHNTAYRNITTELNTCIDSDDYMPDDAVQQIVDFWKAHGSDRFAGIIGLDATADGKIIGTGFDGLLATTLTDFYARGGKGDKKLVYRTDVIRRYPEYPLFEGERYVGLAYKYMLIDQDYQLLTLEKPLVIVEYQPDGSSFGMYRQYWNNPRGFSFYRLTEMRFAPTLKRRFMVCIHYVASSIIARNRRFISESNQKALTILAIPFGIALYLLIRHKVKTNKKMNF